MLCGSNYYEQKYFFNEEIFGKLPQQVKEELKIMCANAVVGVDIDYEVLGANNGMLMVTVSGTAVVCE